MVCIQLGQAALASWQAWLLFAVALVVTLRCNVNSTLLVAGGAVAGQVLGASRDRE